MSTRPAKKKKSVSGYTLVELLIVIAIMVLLAGMATMTIQLASSSFLSSVKKSESKLLMSTLSEAISGELRYTNRENCEITTSNGQVYLNGKAVLPSASYVYGLKANVTSFDFKNSSGKYEITISILGPDNTKLCEESFSVEPLNL